MAKRKLTESYRFQHDGEWKGERYSFGDIVEVDPDHDDPPVGAARLETVRDALAYLRERGFYRMADALQDEILSRDEAEAWNTRHASHREYQNAAHNRLAERARIFDEITRDARFAIVDVERQRRVTRDELLDGSYREREQEQAPAEQPRTLLGGAAFNDGGEVAA